MAHDFVVIIPARGGSVGLPGKNIKPLLNIPLIAWSIQFAKHLPFVSRIIVSTDDQSIANVASEYGAEVPFLREKNISTSVAKSSCVVLDVIRRCNISPDSLFLLLEPTSPYRFKEDYLALVKIFDNSEVNKVVSITDSICSAPHFQYLFDPLSHKLLSKFIPDSPSELRRQDVPTTYYLDGSFYAARVSSFMNDPSFVDSDSYAFVSNYFSQFEIDTLDDFILIEAIISYFGTPSWVTSLHQ